MWQASKNSKVNIMNMMSVTTPDFIYPVLASRGNRCYHFFCIPSEEFCVCASLLEPISLCLNVTQMETHSTCEWIECYILCILIQQSVLDVVSY